VKVSENSRRAECPWSGMTDGDRHREAKPVSRGCRCRTSSRGARGYWNRSIGWPAVFVQEEMESIYGEHARANLAREIQELATHATD